jgi:uncharacterized protein YdbL (DUF1318 family)
MMRILIIAAAASALAGSPLLAQAASPLSGAIQAGQVGERYDGYMGVAAPVAPNIRSQVNAVNIRRRKLYIELAQRRNVTADVVGLATACQLFPKLSPGEAYMLQDGVWRRRGAAPATLPDYCR